MHRFIVFCHIHLQIYKWTFICFSVKYQYHIISRVMEGKIGVTSADKIIEEIGGCGRFQWRLSALIHAMKTVVAFCMVASVIMSKKPTAWWCRTPYVVNATGIIVDATASCASRPNATNCFLKTCRPGNASNCETYEYDNSPSTLVTEVSATLIVSLPMLW